jgi:type IX secretion system PorP/SprF family membrane protein
MKKIYVLLFFIIFSLSSSYAQQPAQYSLYMLNPYGVNPAAAGLKGTLEATGGFRSQWVGIDGNPVTQYLNVVLPLSIVSSGVGFSIHNESIGARNGLTAKASYNYIIKMGDGQLSFGAAGGIVQGSLNSAKLRTPEGDYNQGVIDHKDKILSAVSISGTTPTFDVGIFFKNEKFEGGLSSSNILEPKLKLTGQSDINVVLKRNYFALFGARFDLTNNITIHPSMLIKSDAVQTQMDFSTFVRYNDNIFLGATFRGYNKNSQDAIAAFGGLKLNPKLMLAYSYDITLSAIKTVSQGTHEIVLQYNLGKEFGKSKLPPIIYNPRF